MSKNAKWKARSGTGSRYFITKSMDFLQIYYIRNITHRSDHKLSYILIIHLRLRMNNAVHVISSVTMGGGWPCR